MNMTFPAAITFQFSEEVETLSESFKLSNYDVNPPEVLLSKSDLEKYQEMLKGKVKAAEGNSDSTVTSTTTTELYQPSDSDVFTKAHYIVNVELGLSGAKLVSRSLLATEQHFITLGSIPVDVVDLAFLEAKDREYQEILTLAAPTKPGKKKEKENTKNSEAERRTERLISKRLLPPRSTLQARMRGAKIFEQKEDIKAKIIFHEDPNDRSFIRLRIAHLYKDEMYPKQQPTHKLDIELTYRNTRPRGHLPPDEGDRYYGSERILDVSDKVYQSYLQKLFPHLVKQNPSYCDKLWATLKTHRLYLMQFRQNELPMTTNLFTERADMPAKYHDLQLVMRRAPIIYILARGTDIDALANSVIDRFCGLSQYNPLSRFFVNPHINNKGIMETAMLPKFKALPENAFEDWTEFAIRAGVAAVIEMRYDTVMQIHRGKAAIHPVPHTQYRDGENDTDLALYVNFFGDRPDENLPRLTVGDQVRVDLQDTCEGVRLVSKVMWKGRIVNPIVSTGFRQVCMVVRRPMDGDEVVDTAKYTDLSASAMDKMSSEELHTWAQNNRNRTIIVIKDGSDTECKRLCNGLKNMKVPHKLQPIFEGKEHILEQLRLLMLCKDHTRYDKSSLFSTIHEDDREKFSTIMDQSLRDYQRAPINAWRSEGLFANVAALGGVSGSGKTYTSIHVLCGYTFRVKINHAKKNMQNMDLVLLYHSQVAAAAKKEKAQQAKAEAEAKQDDKHEDDNSKAVMKYKEDDTELVPETNFENEEPNDDNKFLLELVDEAKQTHSIREFEDGRATHVSIQNETVDHSYETWVARMPQLCKDMKAPNKLVIRLHSVQTEHRAVIAMIDSNFCKETSDPKPIERDSKLTGTVTQALLEHYLREMSITYSGITDKRLRLIEGSLAYVILQLARFGNVPITEEVANTWTEEERDNLAEKLKPLIKAREDLESEDRITRDNMRDVGRAFQVGYIAVLQRAAVICTTLAVATTTSLQIYRQAHAVCLEEAGRGIDLDVTALLSTHWACDLIMMVGDHRQLSFSPYGPEIDNPFQDQLPRSTFSRMYYTGFPMKMLKHTSRFTIQPLLDLCRRLNNDHSIQEVPESFDTELEAHAKLVNQQIWGKKSTIVVVDTPTADTRRDATGSWYCIDTALVTIHDVVNRVLLTQGGNVLVITPYNAQLRLLNTLRDGAIRDAKMSGKERLAFELSRVSMLTVDASMGKDRHHVVLDTVGNADGFLWLQPRMLVAGTRARSSLVFVGPASHYSVSKSGINRHLMDCLREWADNRLMVTLDQNQMNKLEQYPSIQNAMQITRYGIEQGIALNY
ncbi:hypothetical protein ACJQWK_04672, partial [Exserohilum turcicum]